MATKDLQENLNWLLLRSSMLAKQRLAKVSEEHNLAPMQAITLCLLEPSEAVPMSMISDLLSCDASNVTGIVERLSVGGYIERRELSSDRRVKTITLTPEGVLLREKILPTVAEHDAPSLKNLTAEEAATLKALLIKTLPEETTQRYFADTEAAKN